MGPNDSELTGELIAAIIGITLLVLALVFWPGARYRAEIPKTLFVETIIGEAEAESYQGKLAVACSIRERGTLKGCNGWKSERVRLHKYGAKVFVDSVRAYEESAHVEKCAFVKGANSWWTRSRMFDCPRIAHIDGHYFFNCKLGRRQWTIFLFL